MKNQRLYFSLVKDTLSPNLFIWREIFFKAIYLLAPPSGV